METLIYTALIGIAAGGLSTFVRSAANSFPAIYTALDWKDGKPIGCPLCMGGWSTLAVAWCASGAVPYRDLPLVFLGGSVIAGVIGRAAFPESKGIASNGEGAR